MFAVATTASGALGCTHTRILEKGEELHFLWRQVWVPNIKYQNYPTVCVVFVPSLVFKRVIKYKWLAFYHNMLFTANT